MKSDLTNQANYQTVRKYWNKLKECLKKEGSETVTNCHQLKMTTEDGKTRLTDVANAETLLRLVQSIPSARAEPINLNEYISLYTDGRFHERAYSSEKSINL
jgi:hypothetical protein